MKAIGLVCNRLLLLAAAAGSAAVNAVELKDPTRPYVGAPVQAVSTAMPVRPRLTSVLLGAHRKLAVIDGQLMREGETVRGVTVIEIASDSAVVSVGGSRLTLALDAAPVRKEIR